jgi:hypothetical protein
MRTVQRWKPERGCGPSPWFAVGRDVFEGSLKAVPTKKSVGPTNSEEGRVPCRHVLDQTSTG